MCDYSLQHLASIPAKVGDRLVTTEFPQSGTRGFSAVGRPDVAVCIRPGAELAFDREVVHVDVPGTLSWRKIAAGVATFRQVNVDQPYVHHDALEFPDGRLVLLNALAPGQIALVLQAPAAAAPQRERVDTDAAPAAPALATG